MAQKKLYYMGKSNILASADTLFTIPECLSFNANMESPISFRNHEYNKNTVFILRLQH